MEDLRCFEGLSYLSLSFVIFVGDLVRAFLMLEDFLRVLDFLGLMIPPSRARFAVEDSSLLGIVASYCTGGA